MVTKKVENLPSRIAAAEVIIIPQLFEYIAHLDPGLIVIDFRLLLG
jgi:hypothetical protein